MSLYDFVKNLQEQSEATRKKILVVFLLIFFLILSGVMVFDIKERIEDQTLAFKFTDEKSLVEKNSKESFTSNILEPFAAIKEGFNLVVKDFKNKSDGVFSKTENIFQSVEEERSVYELPNNK